MAQLEMMSIATNTREKGNTIGASLLAILT